MALEYTGYDVRMPVSTTTKSSSRTGDLTPPVRSLLKDRAYRELKSRILNGELPPGTFMSERQLSAQMDMSKTPIKSALERLDNEGLVRVSPQHGVVVREVTWKEISDQFEIRTALESYTMRALAGRLREDQLEQLEANLAAQKANIETCDQLRLVELDVEFHMLFCEFLDNKEIGRVMRQQQDRVQRVILLITEHDTERFASNYEEHRGIADAVIAGDAELAVRLLLAHFEYGKRRILSPRDVPGNPTQS